jgi:hypothetical protein
MVILRDDVRIQKLKRRSQQLSLIGFLFLAAGLVIIFLPLENPFIFQTLALITGWIVSQIGIYLSHRYARSPRPDEVLDDAVKGVARDGRMYHFLLPAPHVLLTRSGPIVFVLKFQTGEISVTEDKWKQKGIGFRRFFGQEGLGNPAKEAETMIESLASYIRKYAPDVKELDIGAMIVFTSKNIKSLDVKNSTIPAMHFSKVKGFLRNKGQGDPLPKEDYSALQAAFDEAAADLL